MKKVFYIIFMLSFLIACHQAEEPAAFEQAESLLYTAPDSARQLLANMPNAERLEGSAKAHYALLLARATDKAHQSLIPCDTLLNFALDFYKGKSRERAVALLYKACLEDEVERSEEAITHLQEALLILENYPEDRETRRIALSLLGDLYYNHKHYDESIKTYRELMKVMDAPLDSALTLKDIGSYFAMTEQQDSAFYYNRKALETARLTGDSALIANYLHSMALTHQLFEAPDSAIYYEREALKMAPQEEPKGRFYYLLGALLYDKDEQLDSVISYMERAAADTTYDGRFMTLRTLSDLEQERENYEGAVGYLEQYADYVDSLYTNERKVDVQQLAYDYNTRLQVQQTQAREKQKRFVLFMVSMAVIFLLTLYYLHKYHRKRKEQLRTQMQLKGALEKMEMTQTLLRDSRQEMTQLRQMQLEGRAENEQLKQMLSHLASQTASLQKQALHLCNHAFQQTESYQRIMALAAHKEEKEQILPYLKAKELERVHEEVLGIYADYIEELQSQYEKLDEQDILYLCLSEALPDTRAVAIGMGVGSTNNVHQRKSRLKKKVIEN
jgi:tetratricopeptide (TPR) repeat protein